MCSNHIAATKEKARKSFRAFFFCLSGAGFASGIDRIRRSAQSGRKEGRPLAIRVSLFLSLFRANYARFCRCMPFLKKENGHALRMRLTERPAVNLHRWDLHSDTVAGSSQGRTKENPPIRVGFLLVVCTGLEPLPYGLKPPQAAAYGQPPSM